MNATWLGTTDLIIRDGAEIAADGTGIQTALVIEGPYEKLSAAVPQKGQTIDGYPGRVLSTRLVRGVGGAGAIYVTLRADTTAEDKSQSFQPEYSVHSSTVTVPLEAHPRYSKSKTQYGADLTTELTYTKSTLQTEELKKLYARIFGEDATVTKCTVANVIQRGKTCTIEERNLLVLCYDGAVPGTANILWDFFLKWDAGTQSYDIAYPILRRTTEWFGTIQGWKGKVQYIATNEVGDFGSLKPEGNWEYLKVADDVTRTGRLGRIVRTEEYRGAEKWDAQIYGTLTSK